MVAVFIRELRAYYSSILAWTLIAIYLVIAGVMSSFTFDWFAELTMSAQRGMSDINMVERVVDPLMSTYGFLLLFFLPLLTMRLFSEEKRSGTLDLLLTYPLTEAQIIGGKLLATMTVLLLTLLFSACGWLVMAKFTTLEWQIILSGYIGLLLMSCSFVSFGLWTSSLSGSQLVSASLTYGGLLVSWILSAIVTASKVTEYVGDVSVPGNLSAFTKGVVDTQGIVFYLALSLFFLFLTARVLESRKWRG